MLLLNTRLSVRTNSLKNLNHKVMQSLSKNNDPSFGKRMWFSLAMAVGASMLMAILLVLIGMVTYYSRIEGW